MNFYAIPRPLLRKLLFTPALGCGCFVVGLAACIATSDWALLILSGALFGGIMCRTIQLYHIIRKKEYEVLTGMCVSIQPSWGRTRRIRLLDDHSNEIPLRLPKQYHLHVGVHYRFYFTCREGLSLNAMRNSPLFDILVANSFLGCEENGKP